MLGSSMLGRKLSATGLMGAGADRGRAGERLQAALAGLQELRLLREKQGDLVDRALRMERVGAPAGTAAGAPTLETEEQRLEATLTALKQQLSRLRRQDVGLKTHLQQLDQQISELKLDVNKASTEQLECDSRPSSGFYELSDGGSCSLSNSCTSVYSECLSSSQTNLLQPPQSPAVASYNVGPLEPADVCRRRSADESSAQPNPLRATGLHLGSSRIRAGAAGLERPRPRPVSTGDLDRLMPGGPGSYKSLEGNKSSACPIPRTSTMDPRFQSSLMSRSGTEVYHYPSPLHAVALQSPIFSLGEPAGAELAEGQGSPAHTLPHSDSLQRVLGTGPEPRHLSYIDRLLQRGLTLSSVQREAGQDTLQSYSDYYREISVSACPDVSQIEPTLHSSLNSNIIIPEADWARERSQEQVVHPVRNLSVKALESLHRYSYPAATREYSPSETITSATANHDIIQADHTAVVRSHSEIKMTMDVRETGVPERKRPGQRPAIPHSSSTEESQIFDVYAGHMTPSDFVHAQFVPAESQQVKVRQGDRKTKAVKLRRKSSEKPRAVRQQQHGCSQADRTRDAGRGSKAERELRRAAKAKTTPKARPCLGQERRLSGSDSSLCGPGVVYTHRIYPGPNPPPAINKPSKNHRPQWSEPEQPAEQRKKRQGPEVFQGPCVQRHRLRDPYTNAAGSRQMVHSGRPHSSQWIGPPFTLKPPVSSACFYSTLNARYPPAPFPVSSQYPPRCESEYSAECASLFHSTIAESSEGELSDDTTNHFGDSESGQSFRSRSDSDSSPYPDEGEQPDGCGGQEEGGCLVWAEAALGPTAAGLALQRLPHPEPPACRIKASRALKKKIRRFQPASLKVMTLV